MAASLPDQRDRGGNPTINPFINPDGEKDLYNSRQPADDVANYLGPWSKILENGGYPPEEARTAALMVLADASDFACGPKRVITLSDPAAVYFDVALSQPTPDRAPGALDKTIACLPMGAPPARAPNHAHAGDRTGPPPAGNRHRALAHNPHPLAARAAERPLGRLVLARLPSGRWAATLAPPAERRDDGPAGPHGVRTSSR